MSHTYEMAKLADRCIKVKDINKKLTIYSKFLNIYGIISVSITGDIAIIPNSDIESDAFFVFKNKITEDINNHIKQSIKNN